MNFNNHSNLEGQHAFLGASKYHWINYSEDKVADAYSKFLATQNQEKSLLETRCSGALTRVYSAIAIEEDVTDTKGQQTGGLAG